MPKTGETKQEGQKRQSGKQAKHAPKVGVPDCPTETRGILHMGLTAVYHAQQGDAKLACIFFEAGVSVAENQKMNPFFDPHCRHSD